MHLVFPFPSLSFVPFMFRSIRTENLKKGKIEKEEESANEKKKKHV